MTVESQFVALARTVVPRVHPDHAPTAQQRPYLIYQAFGGTPLRWLDNTAADKRHTSLQVSVWASTRAEANALIRQLEDVLCAATVFTAKPITEPRSDAEEDLGLYLAEQDFDIWADR